MWVQTLTRRNYAAIWRRNWRCCFGKGGWLWTQSLANQSLAEFPDLQGNNREFCRILDQLAKIGARLRRNSKDLQENSLLNGTGNFAPVAGNSVRKTGNHTVNQGYGNRRLFSPTRTYCEQIPNLLAKSCFTACGDRIRRWEAHSQIGTRSRKAIWSCTVDRMVDA